MISVDTTAKSNNTNMADILAIRYGTRRTSRAEVYYNYEKYNEPNSEIMMDYFFWAIRTPNYTLLVDTGFSEQAGAERGRTITTPPKDALDRVQIKPEHVKHVVLTHSHYDHAGNTDLFPNARFYMSKNEYQFIAGKLSDKPHLAAPMDSRATRDICELVENNRVTFVGKDDYILKGIRLIELSGHTPGQLVVIIEREAGPVILASDAIHYYEELRLDRPFAVMSSLIGMYRSFESLRQLAGEPGAILVPGHDPEVMERFAPIDVEDPGLGVKIL